MSEAKLSPAAGSLPPLPPHTWMKIRDCYGSRAAWFTIREKGTLNPIGPGGATLKLARQHAREALAEENTEQGGSSASVTGSLNL